jgi:hypothetical protein
MRPEARLYHRAGKCGIAGLDSWAGHVAGMIEMRNAYKISVESPEGKRALVRRSEWNKLICCWIEMSAGIL